MAAIRLSTGALAMACARHPWRAIGAWLALTAFSIVMIGALLAGSLISGGNPTNNPQSKRAHDLVDREFPASSGAGATDTIVVTSDRYTADAPQFRALVGRLAAESRRVHGVAAAQPSPLRSRDGHAALIRLTIPDEHSNAIGKVITAVQRADASPSFDVSITGDRTVDHDLDKRAQQDLRSGELRFGVPAAMIILLAVFGAVVAALMPMALAIVSIIVALAAVSVLAHLFSLSVFVTNILTGMGLALGIDYALFIISRYREERGRGMKQLEAVAGAGATAGRAVLFSGSTFVIAMFGMFLVPNSVMRSLAIGAILVGIVAVVAALTLLPALLGVIGDGVNRWRVPFFGSSSLEASNPEGRFWGRIVRAVLRRPGVAIVLPVTVLLVAASPIFGMHIGTSGVTALPEGSVSRDGYVALERAFPGITAQPATIVVAKGASQPDVQHALERLRSELASDPRFGPGRIDRAPDGSAAALAVPVQGDVRGPAAVSAVRQLRSTTVPEVFAGTGAAVLVGGQTSENIDYFDSVTRPAPYTIAFVLLLTFVLLTIAFRSVVVAGTSVALNLLSVGAAYGLLVLVFQHGVGVGLFGFHHAPTIEAWVPLFLFSVLFGLSMDYQVFLLSRIKERYDATGDTRQAVTFGVASTARIITGAALIIVAVFAGFAQGKLIMFQQMGFGIAVALLIDATIIRSVLLPGVMGLLGRWNWYLPGWLEWLPRVQIEAPQLAPAPPAPAVAAPPAASRS
jgi:RND superfamily putative drug exporter